MLVHSVSRVHNWYGQMTSEDMRRSGRGMADNNALSTHRRQRCAGIDQRFALFDARCRCADQCRRGTQRLRGKLEGTTRARARLIKKQRNVAPHQRRLSRTYLETACFLEQRMNIAVAE